MVVKVFWTICAFVLLSAMALMILGRFPNEVAVVYGFVAFGLAFMGIIMVLPNWISHPEAPSAAERKVLTVVSVARERKTTTVLKSA